VKVRVPELLSSRFYPRAAALAVAALLAMAGCASRPHGLMTPVADATGAASSVEMLVATTRGRSDEPGVMFTGERGLTPSFADIAISIPADAKRKIGEVAWPKKLPPNPATDFTTIKADDLTEQQAAGWFSERVKKTPDRSVLVFVHGFNTAFEDSVYRFAQIVHDSGTHSVPVLITWPSRGSVLAYGYDRESTNYTRDTLEKLFQYVAKDPEVKDVTILAHSMGNWLAVESLRQMAIRNGKLPEKFKNVILASPDLDVDVFRSQIADIGAQQPRFTLFVSRDDRALAASRRVWGDVERLGSIDPEQEPYKQELADNKITVIDLTKVKVKGNLNHTKFAESPEIVRLIGGRLSNGQTLTDSRTGLGDSIVTLTTGAAGAVGTAAGVVISAPIAVVDPNTRKNMTDQMNALGGSMIPRSSRPTRAGAKNADCEESAVELRPGTARACNPDQ
jgi:esterase/lipase superfamily enzyme